MLKVLAAMAVGFVAGRFTWTAVRPWFAQPALARPNYRNAYIPTAVGLVLPLAVFLVEAGRAVAGAAGIGESNGLTGARFLTVVAVAGFCLLGVVDDIAGSGEYRGFRGHFLALSAGHVTTGLFKLLGGAAVAVVVVQPVSGDGLGRLLADAALVALAANAGNLFDRGPGRVTKVAIAAFLVLVVFSSVRPALTGVAVVVGAAAALLGEDLRERLMLGDAGANPLGAAMGLGVVLSTAPATRNVVLVVVLVLNALGEVVSFSRVIDAVPPLRAFDRMGRLQERGHGGTRRRRAA